MQIPLTLTLCRIRQRRLADSAPPKGRGGGMWRHEGATKARLSNVKRATFSGYHREGKYDGTRAACPTIRRGAATERRNYSQQKTPHIRFCETNPFYFLSIIGGTIVFTGTCVVCSSVCKWVRSGKTNPFL